MTKPMVSNTSPLIILAKAGYLHLLPTLLGKVTIPEGVRSEILAGPQDDPMRLTLNDQDWIELQRLEPPLMDAQSTELGRGESEAIELARRIGAELLIDDRAARRHALSHGLAVSGTLSILALASRQKLLTFDEAVVSVQKAGLYVSPRVVDAVRTGLSH